MVQRTFPACTAAFIFYTLSVSLLASSFELEASICRRGVAGQGDTHALHACNTAVQARR